MSFSFLQDIHTIAVESKQANVLLTDLCLSFKGLNAQVSELVAQLKRIADVVNPEASDLALRFTEEIVMGLTKVKMKAKGRGMRADQPPVNWSALSSSGGILFELEDASGNPIPAPSVSDVTTTLVVDDTSKATVSKVDELNYTVSKPAGVSGQIVLSATLAYNSGSPGPFTATQPIILDVPVAADLKIKFTPN